MGTRGPVPKPEALRRRRNEPMTAVTHGKARGSVAITPGRHLHPVAAAWLTALGESGQSDYYEPSDWAQAVYLAEMMTLTLEAGLARGNAALVGQVLAGMDKLLTTESARRRVGLELDKLPEDAADAPKVAVMARYRAAVSG